MEIGLMGAELFHADRKTFGRLVGPSDARTDRQRDLMELMVAFCNFTNAPKKKNKTLWMYNVKKCTAQACANDLDHLSVITAESPPSRVSNHAPLR